MSRKDAIIMAVLINMGMLAVLFATSTVDERPTTVFAPHSSPPATSLSNQAKTSTPSVVPTTPMMALSPVKDELDLALSRYSPPPSLAPAVPESTSPIEEKTIKTESIAQKREEKWIEVTVKEGDALEKIARSYGTSVKAIKEASQLPSERIRVGQVLRIPSGTKQEVAKLPPHEEIQSNYYIVVSGDNPWTIAKKCHVKYSDILALNQLDEDKARNLKEGDKIRIR